MPAFRGDLTTFAGRAHAWSDSLFVDHGIFRLIWTNCAPVVPGRLYRANHPSPAALRVFKRRFGLRTLINLRGPRDCGSDALSREAAQRLGLAHIDSPFESRGAPHRDRILKVAEIFRTMQEPALIHCKSGADRAGLVSGLFILLNGGTSAQALRQLSWRYGHFRRSRTGILDAFFLLYAREAEGRLGFLDWVRDEYDEAGLRASFSASGLSSFITDRVLRRE
jgi:protein tyrosine phosphatase (PTP) superfamily phosphohydrolase (DUF442 family)